MTDLQGVLSINKPAGCTSRDAVNQIQRLVRPRKVGHAGTLDPMATGVLVVCIGSATRLVRLVQDMPKTYEAEFHLGCTSDTDDLEGEVEHRSQADPQQYDTPALAEELSQMVGRVQQQPPAYSAIKVKGRRAYDLARQGKTVELESREVRIDSIDVISYEAPKLCVRVVCGSGVYIRSIARDLGERLGCGGLMAKLTRTAIGCFSLNSSRPLTELDSIDRVRGAIEPTQRAASQLPTLKLAPDAIERLGHGQKIPAEVEQGREYAITDDLDQLRAIGIGLEDQLLRSTINLK